jgi:phosphoribosylformylglycinamidine cyclo-ligase
VAVELDDGYGTRLPSGRTFGEALLEPSIVYVPLVEALMNDDVPIHYLSHITGHGLLKLMRPSRDLGYLITKLPDVPEVLAFMVERAGMSPEAAYSTFNMGCGYAIYCGPGAGDRVVAIATELGFRAHVAGEVAPGPRRVVLNDRAVLGDAGEIAYDAAALDLTPRRAA